MYLQSVAVVCLAALCLGQGPASQYLPPEGGYNYPRPPKPFPSPSPGPTVLPPAPTPPPYRPSPTQPPYRPSPTQPPYRPTPTQPPYRPSPTQPPYRPSPGPSPTYTPSPTYLPTLTGSTLEGGPGIRPSPPPTGPDYNVSPTGTRPTKFGPTDHLNQPHVPGMPFDFNYAVKDDYYGTDFSHNAISDGDQVKGEYRVQLPDGRVQVVSYVADWATGYHANVRYEGEARYPETQGSATQPGGQYAKPAQNYGPPQQPSGPY